MSESHKLPVCRTQAGSWLGCELPVWVLGFAMHQVHIKDLKQKKKSQPKTLPQSCLELLALWRAGLPRHFGWHSLPLARARRESDDKFLQLIKKAPLQQHSRAFELIYERLSILSQQNLCGNVKFSSCMIFSLH